MKIIKSLDKLKILVFWDILKDGNFRRLDSSFSDDKKYLQNEETELLEVWMNLYDDYFKLKKDSKAKQFLKSKQEEILLLYKIDLFKEIHLLLTRLDIYKSSLPKETFEETKANIYKSIQKLHPGLKVSQDLMKATAFITKVISSLTTKYKLNYKKNEQSVKNEIDNVYEVVASVGLVLGVQLNVNEMNVMEWLAYEEMAKQKVKLEKNGKR